MRPLPRPVSRAGRRGGEFKQGVSRMGLVRPKLSFWDFPDFSGFSRWLQGFLPIGRFPLLRPMKRTYKKHPERSGPFFPEEYREARQSTPTFLGRACYPACRVVVHWRIDGSTCLCCDRHCGRHRVRQKRPHQELARGGQDTMSLPPPNPNLQMQPTFPPPPLAQ